LPGFTFSPNGVEQRIEPALKQSCRMPFLTPVREKFNEDIATEPRRKVEPTTNSVSIRKVVTGDLAFLEPRRQPLAPPDA